MKWIKLMCDESDDEQFEAELIDKFKYAGYWRWMKIQKMIGRSMDYSQNQNCDIVFPWRDWQSILNAKRKTLEPLFIYLQSKNKIKIIENNFKLKMSCTNLLNLQDNHQNNLQAKIERESKTNKDIKTLDRPLVDPVSERLSQKQFLDNSLLEQKRFLKKMERLGDQNKLTAADQKQAFNLGWDSYPVKIGKKVAWGHFRKTISTKGDYNRIIDAFNYYHEYVNWRVTDGQNLSWQHGNRWFAEWEDWAVKAETDPQNWKLKRYKL